MSTSQGWEPQASGLASAREPHSQVPHVCMSGHLPWALPFLATSPCFFLLSTLKESWGLGSRMGMASCLTQRERRNKGRKPNVCMSAYTSRLKGLPTVNVNWGLGACAEPGVGEAGDPWDT